jgi:phosphoenolpyruvate---glycerone phosphotransferase subunit DhaL
MELNAQNQRKLVEAVARNVVAHAGELTDLDRAVGDADHGVNMQRGFEAVLADLDGIAAKPLADALVAIGTTLVMKVGGASGPLYGTLFMTMGKSLAQKTPTPENLAAAFDAAIAATRARGKSEAGQKTMLDVLLPAADELHAGGAGITDRLRQRAHTAAQATIAMRAQRGRASYLGERSIGHLDPGARSSEIMIVAICDVLDETT